ncbi:hypothetical protein ABPG75_004385 [Micractinium tetrahymenae]
MKMLALRADSLAGRAAEPLAAAAAAAPPAWRRRQWRAGSRAVPPLSTRYAQSRPQHHRLSPQAEAKQRQLEQAASSGRVMTASEVATAYYSAWNDKRMDDVLSLMAPDVIYQDLIYEDPFVGREALAAYFKKIETLVPKDIKFCVEDITEGDPRRCGVRWHVEIADESGTSVQFPFSRGVSFYETNNQGQIVFARDIVEPAIKPGGASLGGISVVAPLVRKLGPKADPAILKTLPLASGAMWLFYFSYLGYVMLSTSAPGLPVWQTPPETWQAVLNKSYNYFYINIGLAELGLNPVPCVAEHPVSEALFNFMNAWSLMWWPVMLADPLGRRVENKLGLWVGTQFLTNVFFPVYLAQRLRPDTPAGSAPASAEAAAPPAALPGYAPVFGAVAMAVGLVSVGWALGARPEAGDLAARWAYFTDLLATSRVDWAFVVDACLYSVWQAWLLGAAGAAPAYRFVPFWGLAAWLLAGPRGGDAAEQPRRKSP